jgi:hypothetical protein
MFLVVKPKSIRNEPIAEKVFSLCKRKTEKIFSYLLPVDFGPLKFNCVSKLWRGLQKFEFNRGS